MATVAYSSTYWYATTADFRAWGLELSNAMQTAGLVKESTVTGQINWATVNAPGAINTVAGYEVYRFNDALQATAPVFIKIEYGFAAALTVPTMWITVGTTTTTTDIPGTFDLATCVVRVQANNSQIRGAAAETAVHVRKFG